MLCRATPGRPKPDVDRNFMAKKRHTGGDVSIKWPESVASRWKRPPPPPPNRETSWLAETEERSEERSGRLFRVEV